MAWAWNGKNDKINFEGKGTLCGMCKKREAEQKKHMGITLFSI